MEYRTWRAQFPSVPQIKSKIYHVHRVVGLTSEISCDLNLSAIDRRLADFIALHHDDGRFIQWRDYGSFRDRDHPHATLGVKILFDEDHISAWGPSFNEVERGIIRTAIFRHSDFHPKIDDLSGREILHLFLLRDADILDNLSHTFLDDDLDSLLTGQNFSSEEFYTGSFSPAVFEKFLKNEDILYADLRTALDLWLLWASQYSKLIFPFSRNYLKKIYWPEKMFGRVNFDNPEIKAKLIAHTYSLL